VAHGAIPEETQRGEGLRQRRHTISAMGVEVSRAQVLVSGDADDPLGHGQQWRPRTSAPSSNVCALYQLTQRFVVSVAIAPGNVAPDHRVLLFV
jgi:hypothetical protein